GTKYPKIKEKQRHAPGEHIWEGLKKKSLSLEEETDFLLNETNGLVNLIKRLKHKEYIETISLPSSETNTTKFSKYIEELKDYGLDIGKGDSEYGYKMLLPEKGESFRKLIIFRR
ncbi:MAG: hypothetical protein AABW81_02700, partial [Nanoarchaeota archaeon]